MNRNLPPLTALVLAIASAAFHVGTARAADLATAPSSYEQDRADCEAGRTSEDRATCLKEAGAVAQERKRNGLANAGSARENATERCNGVSPQDKADCMARIEGSKSANQQVITSGSVRGGGILRETRTRIVGQPTTVPAAPESAASAVR